MAEQSKAYLSNSGESITDIVEDLNARGIRTSKPINIPTSDEIENMDNSSDIGSNVSPKTKRTLNACKISGKIITTE